MKTIARQLKIFIQWWTFWTYWWSGLHSLTSWTTDGATVDATSVQTGEDVLFPRYPPGEDVLFPRCPPWKKKKHFQYSRMAIVRPKSRTAVRPDTVWLNSRTAVWPWMVVCGRTSEQLYNDIRLNGCIRPRIIAALQLYSCIAVQPFGSVAIRL